MLWRGAIDNSNPTSRILFLWKDKMSRTHKHTKLKFVVPQEEIDQHSSYYTIMNWRYFYNKFYPRYKEEKVFRKLRNRQVRATLRTMMARMCYFPDEFDSYIHPLPQQTLSDLD